MHRSWILARFACRFRRLVGLSIAGFVFAATAMQADTQQPGDWPFCASDAPLYGQMCQLIDIHCVPFLDGPRTFDRTALRPMSPGDPRNLTQGGVLSQDVLGYISTGLPNTRVVYIDREPACGIVMAGVAYSEALLAYRAWSRAEGAGFGAVGMFEPRIHPNARVIIASAFLAAPRSDGRVTELTWNWGLVSEDAIRLTISYQTPRPYTDKIIAQATPAPERE